MTKARIISVVAIIVNLIFGIITVSIASKYWLRIDHSTDDGLVIVQHEIVPLGSNWSTQKTVDYIPISDFEIQTVLMAAGCAGGMSVGSAIAQISYEAFTVITERRKKLKKAEERA